MAHKEWSVIAMAKSYEGFEWARDAAYMSALDKKTGVTPGKDVALELAEAAGVDFDDITTSAITVRDQSMNVYFDKTDMSTDDPEYIQATVFAENESNWAYINEQIMQQETRDVDRLAAMVLVASR